MAGPYEPQIGEVPPHVAAARARYHAGLPASYRPWRHLAAPFVCGAAVIAGCVACLEGPALKDMVVVPAMWIFSIALEWRFHRDLLHRRVAPLQLLYDKHTVSHHSLYVDGAMEIGSARDFRSILFPWWALPALAAALGPPALLVGLVFGGDVGRLFLATGVFYVMVYEALHLTYHLRPSHPLRRLPGVERLAQHHARHHDPRRMQRENLGVTSTLWDRLRGTMAR
ncbi:Fatty acid hydroxylase superfamily protein [Nannocystis exedens]|uniref:Fatty acid hydroxylase superfamily protein n=1 Tax=Nannocystis exedens TaxID=54 RepID=A0A1I2CIC3_9BACT|nr:sterol desaturase family protein [Nannocystis exedens]PCC68273.1 Fatty acid hydroxylase superfamily protein [Nannocystis exedens]SFE68056.1 Fatty acid hydroxylase superfamily protein [Nannocystis exedens]